MTGPEAVTISLIAEAISLAIGDQVRSLDPPLSQALKGVDRWTSDVVGGMFGRVHDGVFAEVTDIVEQVTGHRPRAIQQFITENHEQWRT